MTPGWYPDPTGRSDARWWDGTQWTEQVRAGSLAGRDPLDPAGRPTLGRPGWTVPKGASRGLVIGLSAVGVTIVVLVVALVIAGVSFLRALPRLSTAQIESVVAKRISTQLGTPVSVDCPETSPWRDGTLNCLATETQSGQRRPIRVTVRDSKVIAWEFADQQ